MRRVILLIAAILLASVGRSQTMTITLNDGSTVKYDMNNVKSIEFTNDNSGTIQETTSPLVGIWELTDEDGDYYTFEFKADGSFYEVEYEGTTDKIKRYEKGTYKILSVSGNIYEVSIIIKERQKRSGKIVIVNEEQTGFLTLSDNNNTMTSSGNGNIWKRKQ